MQRTWVFALLFLPSVVFGAETRVVDAFEDASLWSAHPADGVKLALSSDEGAKGRSLRLDFEFTGGGYAVVHRKIDLDLPENYAFSFRVRGKSPSNHLEFKLIDASGENVWWYVFRDVAFNGEWQTFTIKKRKIQFAWGPKGGGEISHVAAIEFAVTAGSGGNGTVWLDDLDLRPMPPPNATPPTPSVRVSSGANAGRVLDGNPETAWRAATKDQRPWIQLDFKEPREYGGLVVDWEKGAAATDYVVEGSTDRKTWTTLRGVTGGNGGRDYLFLPESESRFVRLRVTVAARDVAVREIAVKPLEWSASKESFFKAIALDTPRGAYPRGMRGEPSVWTVVGPDNSTGDALLSGDGALEWKKKQFSIEPFLFVRGRLLTWADVHVKQSLEKNYLPIPSVTWKTPDVTLTATALASGSYGTWRLFSQYQVKNTTADSLTVLLFLAIRPFQVNPPSQGLNISGGCAPIQRLEYSSSSVRVNEEQRSGGSDPRWVMNTVSVVRSLASPSAFGATSFVGGDLVMDYLSRGVVPPDVTVTDPFEAASGAFAYRLKLASGDSARVDLVMPPGSVRIDPNNPEGISFDREMDVIGRAWENSSNQISIKLPKSAEHVIDVFRSQLNYILVNRTGPAIQPGTRAYARSWIRDGSLTSSALLRAGRPDVVKEFIEWFTPHQYSNGKVPCVVDWRGADPVPEHDSTGEFLFLLAEYYRLTSGRLPRDRHLVERYWPGIVRAVAYLDSLRHERINDEYRKPENARYYGILPPSISHEGYSAKPMHSYWDDFFALRGFKDAAFLARELGHSQEANQFAEIRDAFAKDLAASIARAMKDHNIDYVPGCADLGDFDATSTTIALSPAEATFIPRSALEATFERYYKFFVERKNGAPWEAFTPYEIRNIGAFVRLGWRDRAHELLEYFLDHQTPKGWNQWAEVVWRDTTTARFIGDMPHTWVGSDYMRSFLDFFAYEREQDQALVLAAGIPSNWVRQDDGVAIKDLRTQYGPLSYSLVERKGVLEASIGKMQELPPGGIVLRPPLPERATKVTVNGKRVKMSAEGEVIVRQLPALVRWSG